MVFYEERETKEAAEIRKSEITSRPKTKQIDFIVSKNPNLDEIELQKLKKLPSYTTMKRERKIMQFDR